MSKVLQLDVLHATIAALLLGRTDASHVEREPFAPTQEQLVVVGSMVRSVRRTTKAIQAQLSRKGQPRGMLEILGKYFLHEPFCVMDDKGSAVR
jgi:hypothetical protein